VKSSHVFSFPCVLEGSTESEIAPTTVQGSFETEERKHLQIFIEITWQESEETDIVLSRQRINIGESESHLRIQRTVMEDMT